MEARAEITVETDSYLKVSAKVAEDDIDWATARSVGLTEAERYILTYMADIEAQTIMYLRDLLKTEAAFESDVVAFLSMWNYEEYFHGRLLERLLRECGGDLGQDRVAEVRRHASFSEKLESLAANILSWIFRPEFPALYTAWGAVQELTTLRGYEQLARTTQNPALKSICDRIAKQERRHFAWYFNNAKWRLGRSSRAQRLTKFLLHRFWTPVGAGVKSPAEVARLLFDLFPAAAADEMALEIDGKISTLPGLDGLKIMSNYLLKARQQFGEGRPA